MIENLLTKPERKQFNDYTKKQECLNFLRRRFSLEPGLIDYPENLTCSYDDSSYKDLLSNREFFNSSYSSESSHGKFFLEKLNKVRPDPDADYLEFMDNLNLF